MTSRINVGVKDNRIVTLEDVVAGEKGITCYTCGSPLCCKDGKGKHIRNERGHRVGAPKGKHFAHTLESKCYGEGPAHYRLKELIALTLNGALSRQHKDSHKVLGINYPCPSAAYGVKCSYSGPFPFQPNHTYIGSHWFDLLRNLAEVKTEHRLGNRFARPDVVGLDCSGKPIWIIEIYRTHQTSAKCREYARENGLPLFQVNIDDIPVLPNSDDPYQELEYDRFWVRADNAANGFLFADRSWNTTCPREVFGMPVDARSWGKIVLGQEDGTVKTVHACGEAVCPDWRYMQLKGLDYFGMYLNPEHLKHSHTYAGPG